MCVFNLLLMIALGGAVIVHKLQMKKLRHTMNDHVYRARRRLSFISPPSNCCEQLFFTHQDPQDIVDSSKLRTSLYLQQLISPHKQSFS